MHELKRLFAAEETRHASLLRRILLLPRMDDSQNFMALLVAAFPIVCPMAFPRGFNFKIMHFGFLIAAKSETLRFLSVAADVHAEA